ncbi:MAG: hypothetical protein ACOYOQ_06730 [Microthrixaceae bacterium]
MRTRSVAAVALVALVALTGSACSSEESADTTTTSSPATTGPVGGNVLPPVVLTPQETSATVDVGTKVVFNVGEPGEGRFVATSADPAVFKVENEGKSEGTYSTNAGGVAVAPGTTEVTVQFFGSTNGVGSPTTFTITVE